MYTPDKLYSTNWLPFNRLSSSFCLKLPQDVNGSMPNFNALSNSTEGVDNGDGSELHGPKPLPIPGQT